MQKHAVISPLKTYITLGLSGTVSMAIHGTDFGVKSRLLKRCRDKKVASSRCFYMQKIKLIFVLNCSHFFLNLWNSILCIKYCTNKPVLTICTRVKIEKHFRETCQSSGCFGMKTVEASQNRTNTHSKHNHACAYLDDDWSRRGTRLMKTEQYIL